MNKILVCLILGTIAAALSSCSSSGCGAFPDRRNEMIVSVRDQKLLLVRDGVPLKAYKVSTSKFGIGDKPGSGYTPLGSLCVKKKIGCNAPEGMVFKSRRPTGEILPPNAPGRDPIVSRIMWLEGTEDHNRNAFRRYIYIHGTPEESRLGTPASYGCIRMASRDVIDLYNLIGIGARIQVIRGPLTDTDPGKLHASVLRRGMAALAAKNAKPELDS